jgi:hypothetical protein
MKTRSNPHALHLQNNITPLAVVEHCNAPGLIGLVLHNGKDVLILQCPDDIDPQTFGQGKFDCGTVAGPMGYWKRYDGEITLFN